VAAPYGGATARFTQNSDMEHALDADPTLRMIGYGSLTNRDPHVVALTVEGIVADVTTVSGGTYPMGRNLHLYTAPTTGNNKQRIQDYLTWIQGLAGQAIVDNYGYVNIGTVPPAWDVNLDHAANVLDLTSIGAKWQQTGPASGDPVFTTVRGWIREDVNFDAAVNVLDLTTVGGHWQGSW
jgi:hypothetical protein